MPRKRTDSKDKWLPSRVYRGKSSYEYRPKEGGCIKLLALKRDDSGNVIETDQTKVELFAAFTKAQEANKVREDLDWLIAKYMGSLQFSKLSSGQQQNDHLRLKRISPVFGKMMPANITPGHIRKYMDKLGATKEVSANRDHGFLSRLFNWAIERNYMKTNPCEKVKKFVEKSRDRYPEDWEYDLMYEVALASSYPWLAPMMEISYLCRMRDSEVRGIMEDIHILDEGIFVERSKGSANEITAWSPRLKKAVDDARRLANPNAPTRIKNQPLFKGRSGGPITESNRKTAWTRVRKIAMTEGLVIDGVQVVLKEPFNFHDIKAKGVTDHEDKASGHRSKKMHAIYDRKPSIIKATR